MLYYDIFIVSKDKERNEIMKKYLWVVYPIFSIVFLISSIHKVNVARERTIEKFDKDYKESKKVVKSGKNEEFDSSLEIPSMDTVNNTESNTQEPQFEPIGLVEEEPIVEEIQEVPSSYTTRMTSYYPAESSDCTGSGKCSWDFTVNDKGWYTYNGKLVVATATTYLANQGWYVAPGVHLYEYWEELVLTIDGIEYDAIILDSCGSSMRTDRVDLFVSNANSVKDTMINVRRK